MEKWNTLSFQTKPKKVERMASQNQVWELTITRKGGICGERNLTKLSALPHLIQLGSGSHVESMKSFCLSLYWILKNWSVSPFFFSSFRSFWTLRWVKGFLPLFFPQLLFFILISWLCF
jgi:hypothetical protein